MVTQLQQGNETSFLLSDINIRIRSLETKHNLLGERLLLVNQNMIEEYKKTLKELDVINSEISEIKNDVRSIKTAIKDIVKEMEVFAKKEHLKVLEKYINIWNPMNFVTSEELEKIIQEKLKKGDQSGRATNR